jgi:hypothetical protein
MGTSDQTDLALSEHGYLSNEMMERIGVRIYVEANIMGVIQVPRGRVGYGAYETPEREGSSKRINPSLYLYLNNLKSSWGQRSSLFSTIMFTI